MDVMRAEAEVSRRDQDLTVAKTNLQLQESLIKNALTKNLDDPDARSDAGDSDRYAGHGAGDSGAADAGADCAGLLDRPELSESDIDLQNREITRKAAANALLPTLDAGRLLRWHRPGRRPESASTRSPITPLVPTNWWGSFQNAFNNSSPDYFVGLNLNIPDSQPRGQGRSVSFRAGVPAGRAARAATEEADSHRSTQRGICAGAGARARGGGQKGTRPGAEDIRDHAERTGSWERDRASRR